MLAIVDPANLQIVARVPAGPDPHEIVASPDGKLAYISNYGGAEGTLNTISVVDVAARKAWLRSILGRYVPRMDWRSRAASFISQRRRTRSSAVTILQRKAWIWFSARGRTERTW